MFRIPGLEFHGVKLTKDRLGLLLALVVLSVSLPAQTGHKVSAKPLPASSFKLTSIKVTGTKRYTPDEIIAASGLQLGQTVSEDDFRRVSRHLGESGAFANVAYSFQYSPEGTRLELQLADNSEFVPARFDNFVWFSDQELLEKLREQVPLFRGQLPLAGELPDQVSDALQALLIERKVEGRADYLRSSSLGGPIDAIVFSVTGPKIRIRNVEFMGAGESELPLLQAAAKNIPGQDYLRSALQVQAEKDLLPIYLERGHLKATFADAVAKVVQESPQEMLADVSFPVDPGRQYKATEILLSGCKVFRAEKLRELIHQQLGQPANAVQLGNDLEAMRRLYGTRGYMAVSIQPSPEMDDRQSTVRYLLQFREGDVYKMGDLEIQGVDGRTTARLVEAWKLRAGVPYDSSYPNRFLEESANAIVPLREWNVTIHVTQEQEAKTVDVTLRFDPRLSR